MAIFKKDLFETARELTEGDDNEQIFKYIFDYFDTSECAALIEHIKEEKGIILKNDNDEEEK